MFTTDAYGIDPPPRGFDELWRITSNPQGDATVEGIAADDPYSGPTGNIYLHTVDASAIDHLIALRPAAPASTK